MIYIYLLLALGLVIFSVLLVIFFVFQVIAAFTTDAPFVPIPKEVEGKIIETLKLDDKSVLYDLGCGDARVLLKAIRKYPNIKAVGIEIAFFPYILAKLKTRKFGNIKIRRQNVFTADLSYSTHIFVYLFPKAMERLMPILEKQCKVGTRIISCDFEDKNWQATEVVELNPLAKRGKRLIVYTI